MPTYFILGSQVTYEEPSLVLTKENTVMDIWTLSYYRSLFYFFLKHLIVICTYVNHVDSISKSSQLYIHNKYFLHFAHSTANAIQYIKTPMTFIHFS